MQNLSDIYKKLTEVLKREEKKNSIEVEKRVKLSPWYFYLSKKGVTEFLANGAPDKTVDLFATNEIMILLKDYNDSELKLIKEFSELNIKIHKEHSIELLTFRAMKVLAIIGSMFLFLLSIGKLRSVTGYFGTLYEELIEFNSDFIIFLYIPLVIFSISMVLFFISMIARVYFLSEAIELDNTLKKAILNINFMKENPEKPATNRVG